MATGSSHCIGAGLFAGLIFSGEAIAATPAWAPAQGALDAAMLGAGLNELAVLIWAPLLALVLFTGIALLVLLRPAAQPGPGLLANRTAVVIDEVALIEALRDPEPIAESTAAAPRKRRAARRLQRRPALKESALSAPAAAISAARV